MTNYCWGGEGSAASGSGRVTWWSYGSQAGMVERPRPELGTDEPQRPRLQLLQGGGLAPGVHVVERPQLRVVHPSTTPRR